MPTNPRLMMIVHGFGEHSGRYEHFPFYLQGHVDAIGTLDLYGHGQSEGKRGSARSAEDWLGGIETALKWMDTRLRREASAPKIVAFGHSFGGLLTLEMARQKRWHGVKHLVLSAPLMALVNEPPTWKTMLGTIIEPFAPQLQLANDISPEVVSHDPNVILAYTSDPLNHSKITPRAYLAMTEMMQQNFDRHQALGLPLHLILPGADPLVSERKNFVWFQKLETDKHSPKTLLSFPGFRHESFNEVDKARAFHALAGVLDASFLGH